VVLLQLFLEAYIIPEELIKTIRVTNQYKKLYRPFIGFKGMVEPAKKHG
jgi:hypothetical protein